MKTPPARRRVGSRLRSRSKATTPAISLIIRAFNEEEHIGRLLTGVLQQSLRPREILLVDSGSTDATLAIARRFPVRILHLPREQFSFGRSLNLGCRAARGDLLVMASAHVYPVYQDWLERLAAPFRELGVALAYGRQRGDARSRFSEARVFAQWYPERSQGRQATDFCNNANSAIRRSLWLRHPFQEDLPALEDLEWGMWARRSGHDLAYVAEAEVIHVHQETRGQVYNRFRREAMALKRLRPEIHLGLGEFLRLVFSSAWGDARSAWRQGRPAGVLREIAWFRFLQYWGTYRGFRLSGPLTHALKTTFFYPDAVSGRGTTTARRVAKVAYGSPDRRSTHRRAPK